MKRKWPPNEEALGVELVKYLTDLGWEVYQEVSLGYGGNRADIVAVQNNLVWIIEFKTSLSLKLLEQCYNWKRYAHYVSAAIPTRRKLNELTFVNRLCKDYGIGIMTIGDPDKYTMSSRSNINELVISKLNRKACTKRITDILSDEHKIWAKAGNSTSKFYTPFQGTSRRVQDEVKARPGIMLKELIESITHHYASDTTAKACISKYIQDGVIANIRYERDGKSLRFYYTKE